MEVVSAGADEGIYSTAHSEGLGEWAQVTG